MDSKVNYTVVGIFVVALTLAGLAIFFWLSDLDGGKIYKTYLVYVKEEVTGLAAQSPVRFNGVRVGYVDGIKLDPRNPQLVKLTLKIEQGTPITTSTVSTLRLQGITGVIYVGLSALTVNARPLRAAPGQEFPVIPSKPSFFVQFGKILPAITENIKAIGENIRKLLDKQNREAVRDSLQNIDKFTQTLASNSENINASLQSLRGLLANTEKASKQLPGVMQQLHNSLSQIHVMAKQIGKATKSFDKTMKSGTYAINSFTSQLLPGAQQTLSNLSDVSSNLSSLTNELERNPSILIRGKQPAAPGPGEQRR